MDKAGVQVAAHDPGSKALEVFASERGALPLHPTAVGTAGHADIAVAPFLLADPLLSVEPVLGVIEQRVVCSVGVPPPAHVLNDACVAVVG